MDRSELMALTVKELRAKAGNLDVKRISSLNKKDLVEAILNAEACNASDGSKADEKTLADSVSVDSNEKSDAEVNSEAADVKSAEMSDKSMKSTKKADDTDASAAKIKKAKAAKKADDADAVDDDADDADDAVTAKVKKAKSAKKEAVEEPAPVEPSSIFIDHGAILPEYVPGTCLYALVRDPGTLFVYWNATFESQNGWLLTAYDAAGNELQSFTTSARRNGRGYFRVPTARVARVTLSVVTDYGSREVKLESKIKIAQQLGIVQPAPKYDERWVDVQNHEVIYEAPAPGRAPETPEVYQSMNGQGMTGGGFDRSVESHNGNSAASNQMGSTSSRFGSLNAPGSNAPGSSDTLVAYSASLIRR